MPYAFDKLNIPNADGVVEYPSPTADYDYGSILKIPTDKNALRSLFKQHGTRIRNMNEAVEIIRRTTGCPRSLLRRPEEVEKIKSFLVSYHNKFMSKRVRNLQR